MKTSYSQLACHVTKDGSEIRELMHPAHHGNRSQSLAEARLRPGQETLLHEHACTEELYHITAGEGMMTLGDTRFPVRAGDTVHIAPGTAHRIRNTGSVDLRVLCCCAPPYSHDDTLLLDSAAPPCAHD